MLPNRKKSLLAAIAIGAATASTAVQAGPVVTAWQDNGRGDAPAVQIDSRPPLFDFERLFPDLVRDERRGHRNAISATEAARIARQHTPMRVIGIERQRGRYLVRGRSRGRGVVEVAVNAHSGRVIDTHRVETGNNAAVAISSERAGRIAQRHIDMRINDIDLNRGVYRVEGFNNARGEVVVEVNARNGNVIRSFATNRHVIDRSEAIDIARNNTRIRVASAGLTGDVWHVNGRRGGLVKVDARTGAILQTLLPRQRNAATVFGTDDAARVAASYTPMQVIRVDTEPSRFVVHGRASSGRHVVVDVDRSSRQVVNVSRGDGQAIAGLSAPVELNERTNAPAASSGHIGVENARRIARRHGMINIHEIRLRGGAYDVEGIDRDQEPVNLRIDAVSGRIL